MTTDELIEELKKAPSGVEVSVEIFITPDLINAAFHSRSGCYKEKLRVNKVRHVPETVIEVLM